MAAYLVTVQARQAAAAPHILYLLDGELTTAHIQMLTAELLHDSVVQLAHWQALANLDEVAPAGFIEVAYKPGVTDTEAESILVGAHQLGIGGLRAVKTLRRFWLPEAPGARRAALAQHFNPLIQAMLAPTSSATSAQRAAFYAELLHSPAEVAPQIARVELLQADDAALTQISRAGVLSLDLHEMHAIQAYFVREGRPPSDGELETLAQTWSEHCSHKTFKARVRYGSQAPAHALPAEHYPALALLESAGQVEIDSLIKTFLISATNELLARRERQPELGDEFKVLSAFVDNAGIMGFGAAHEVSIKVETHNHPSALEPFGGANTGVGGVVRDILGVSALPIANTDVLCFGPLDLPEPAEGESGAPHHHPRNVAAGVVAGVRDYGNKLGIPIVNGAVLYDPGYTANPLVFCGTVGLAPRGSNPHSLQPGDAVVVLGGRTGRDGIHGATFSSAELTHTTAEEVGSAVQIGDPITEKKVLDVLLQARDAGLYSAITDCGAGGLSSAVGELGADTGVRVALDDVPLKYAGLQPWEIWLSEAQERMVLAVPQRHLARLLALCAAEDVEATVIGQFTGDGRLSVTHRGATVVDLSMQFLHKGIPQRTLDAVWNVGTDKETIKQEDRRQETGDSSAGLSSPISCLLSLLAHPNIASKEPIVRTYDHEVRGGTVVKPLVGARSDGPGDAAVLQPLRQSRAGLALGCGINPRYGQIDAYWMALACVDEAMRNVVAVGGDPSHAVLLDNFCWGDPREPDRMAGLVRAAAGCHDAALAFGAPFVSGKDSLNNEYRDAHGQRTPIPPTLLITALAHTPDVRRSVTMDLKEAGNYVYLVGETRDELGGAHIEYGRWRIEDSDVTLSSILHPPSSVPKVDLATAPKIMRALHTAIAAGLVRACHDLSEGGLGVAAAEMAFAGDLGLRLELSAAPRPAGLSDDATILFSESPTRFLAEVPARHSDAFEAALAGLPCARVGLVAPAEAGLVVDSTGGQPLFKAGLEQLRAAWQSTAVI